MLFVATIVFISLLTASPILCEDIIDPGVMISNVDRVVDISSQIAKYITEYTVQNDGKSSTSLNYFIVLHTAEESRQLSFIGATQDKSDEQLKVTPTTIKGLQSDVAYKVQLVSPIAPGSKTLVRVESMIIQYLKPYPSHITQAEQQFVVYEGNAVVTSVYNIRKQTTAYLLYPGKTESFTKIDGAKQEGDKITYGPYDNIVASTKIPIRIHYENNSPFLVVTSMERILEVSHWGNIAIEEHISLLHKGAILKGSFSRLDYQMDRRGHKQPVVRGFKTILPASARDIYYRDEIGNISTSNVRLAEDSVELEIRPRFPLFGGWKTNYHIGYNVPSYEYLFSSGNKFALKMRFVDHIFDNAIVEQHTLKIILPEGSKNIKLETPYAIKRLPDELHYTYLDTSGRPVIIARKDNLVESHIQPFTLHYEFDRVSIWREPFIAIVAFYILFIAVIVYVRFDFTIAADATTESRMKVQGIVTQLEEQHAQRIQAYDQYTELINKYKQSKDMTTFTSGKKKVENELKTITNQISEIQTQIKASSVEIAEKINELQRIDKAVREVITNYFQQVERLVTGKIAKPQFGDTEKAFKQKMDEHKDKADSIAYAL